jgi:LysR family transcriptional regulator, glycine cleavage system transcriptional activator
MRSDPSHLPPLDLLAAFETVARCGSITRAAAERFVTQSAMSRQLQALESDLGTPLFVRRHRALELTPAGQRLLGAITPMLAQLRETVAAIRAPSTRETLALTTTPGFASLWLIPRLAGFTREHPGVDVRLEASFEVRDLAREGFDIAVRYGPVDRSPGQPLFGETIVPVCSPALLEREGAPLRTPADLARHTLLQVVYANASAMPLEWESWLQANGAAPVQPAALLSFNAFNETITAAVEGQGVALGRRPLVDALLRSGRLVVPFGDATATRRGYFLIVSPAARRRASVRALERWLMQQAEGAAGSSVGPLRID